jgi:hypothetical protein
MDDGIEFISVARKIMEVALKIEEAVETVRQNERECREVARCAARVGGSALSWSGLITRRRRRRR